jgi:hypothetical protein
VAGRFTIAELNFAAAGRTVADKLSFFAGLAGFRAAVFVRVPAVPVVRARPDAGGVLFFAEPAGVFSAGFFDLLLLAEDAASAGDECKVINAKTNRLRIRAIILPSGPVTGGKPTAQFYIIGLRGVTLQSSLRQLGTPLP